MEYDELINAINSGGYFLSDEDEKILCESEPLIGSQTLTFAEIDDLMTGCSNFKLNEMEVETIFKSQLSDLLEEYDLKLQVIGKNIVAKSKNKKDNLFFVVVRNT